MWRLPAPFEFRFKATKKRGTLNHDPARPLGKPIHISSANGPQMSDAAAMSDPKLSKRKVSHTGLSPTFVGAAQLAGFPLFFILLPPFNGSAPLSSPGFLPDRHRPWRIGFAGWLFCYPKGHMGVSQERLDPPKHGFGFRSWRPFKTTAQEVPSKKNQLTQVVREHTCEIFGAAVAKMLETRMHLARNAVTAVPE